MTEDEVEAEVERLRSSIEFHESMGRYHDTQHALMVMLRWWCVVAVLGIIVTAFAPVVGLTAMAIAAAAMGSMALSRRY